MHAGGQIVPSPVRVARLPVLFVGSEPTAARFDPISMDLPVERPTERHRPLGGPLGGRWTGRANGGPDCRDRGLLRGPMLPWDRPCILWLRWKFPGPATFLGGLR